MMPVTLGKEKEKEREKEKEEEEEADMRDHFKAWVTSLAAATTDTTLS